MLKTDALKSPYFSRKFLIFPVDKCPKFYTVEEYFFPRSLRSQFLLRAAFVYKVVGVSSL